MKYRPKLDPIVDLAGAPPPETVARALLRNLQCFRARRMAVVGD